MKTPDTKIGRDRAIRKKLKEYIRVVDIDSFMNARNQMLKAKPVDLVKTKGGYKKLYDFIESIGAGDFS